MTACRYYFAFAEYCINNAMFSLSLQTLVRREIKTEAGVPCQKRRKNFVIKQKCQTWNINGNGGFPVIIYALKTSWVNSFFLVTIIAKLCKRITIFHTMHQYE